MSYDITNQLSILFLFLNRAWLFVIMGLNNFNLSAVGVDDNLLKQSLVCTGFLKISAISMVFYLTIVKEVWIIMAHFTLAIH
jgi:hypothetical protein